MSGSAKLSVCVLCGQKYPPSIRFCPSDGEALRQIQAHSDPLIGAVVGDRYFVERIIGVGGMGVVYLAEHIHMERKCALKVLKPEMVSQPGPIRRFSREARNSSRIAHPNVAAVYDFGSNAKGLMYIAMEFVDGPSLHSVLEKEGRLAPPRVVAIAWQIALGLEAAHSLGIVHRDLKPDNILLARSSDGADKVKVIDFGIARAMRDEAQKVTSISVRVGTPAYMSPEQLAGDAVDARSDIYSLGLVCYAMLTDALPFGSSQADLLLRFLQSPRPLSELDPATPWPDAMQTVLNCALAANPDDRYLSSVSFASALADAASPLATAALDQRVGRAASGDKGEQSPEIQM